MGSPARSLADMHTFTSDLCRPAQGMYMKLLPHCNFNASQAAATSQVLALGMFARVLLKCGHVSVCRT